MTVITAQLQALDCGCRVALSERCHFLCPFIIACLSLTVSQQLSHAVPSSADLYVSVLHLCLFLQPCRMAADPSSALLLQPACQAVSDWHHYIASSIFGPMLLWLTSDSSITNAAACSSMAMAAKTLGWYAQASYGVLMPMAGFCTLEWRLKARYVREKLGKQLVYGPFGWPRSEHEPSTFASYMQYCLSWTLVSAAALGLLWVGLTWLVPLLPLMPCQTCADKRTCQSVTCGKWRSMHVRHSTTLHVAV